MEALKFDSLARTEVPVTIEGKEYVLQEATEKAASEYLDLGVSNLELSEGKVCGMRGGAANSAVLVSRCLFLILANEGGERTGLKSVHLDTIRAWPSRVVKPIFEAALKISGLEAKEEKTDLLKQRKELDEKLAKIDEDAAKNDLSDTTTTSE
jgi:hypothetical protein